jgi:two-component system response regulator YesN
MKKLQGKKVTEKKKRGQKKRKPYLSTCAKEIIYNYSPWDIGNLSVKELARKLCVSVENLSKTFKKETGVKLGDIVLNQKMYVSAAFLIQNPELSVKKITEIIGYCSVDYFSIVFKRFFGITPGRFRHRLKNIISQINEKI